MVFEIREYRFFFGPMALFAIKNQFIFACEETPQCPSHNTVYNCGVLIATPCYTELKGVGVSQKNPAWSFWG